MVKKRTIANVSVLLAEVRRPDLPALRGHFSAATNESSSRLVLHRCELPDIQGEVRCGTYEVFEDRSAKSGRTIKLKIVVLKAVGASRRLMPSSL